MKTIVKMLVACIVATFMAGVLIMHDASDNLVIVTMFTAGIAVSALLGVFDVPAKRVNKKQSNRTIGGVLKDAA